MPKTLGIKFVEKQKRRKTRYRYKVKQEIKWKWLAGRKLGVSASASPSSHHGVENVG